MSGYLAIIVLVSMQMARVMSVTEYAEKKLQNNIWLAEMDDKHPGTKVERNDQFETVGDVILKDTYPKIARRGYAGEEFFLKASKSVPRIGRRNNDFKDSSKRLANKDQLNVVEHWPYFQAQADNNNNNNNDLAGAKHDSDPSSPSPYNCQQMDAKTIFLVDLYNSVCNDQLYCCTPAKRNAANYAL